MRCARMSIQSALQGLHDFNLHQWPCEKGTCPTCLPQLPHIASPLFRNIYTYNYYYLEKKKIPLVNHWNRLWCCSPLFSSISFQSFPKQIHILVSWNCAWSRIQEYLILIKRDGQVLTNCVLSVLCISSMIPHYPHFRTCQSSPGLLVTWVQSKLINLSWPGNSKSETFW